MYIFVLFRALRAMAIGLVLPIVFNHPPNLSQNYQPACKAALGTPEWPHPEAWKALNESTGGRLLQSPPPGAVCHPGQPTYNSSLCPTVQEGWRTYPFHDENPISVGSNQFSNDCCLPFDNYTCTADGYPVYTINATTVEHVKLGIDFARENNIRLVVKATGHDFMGRSVGSNSLSIWTRYLTGTTLNGDEFYPQGCGFPIKSSSITALGGTQALELQSAAAAANQTVIFGGSYTLSIGGYITGGGHGLLSSRYGLAADQVLQMEVVTPKGDVLILNQCQNQDLFWAMRGGGGSTFGILTSVTVKSFPTPKIMFGIIKLGTTDYTNAANYDVFAYILSQFPSLSDTGLTGYSFLIPEILDPVSGNSTIALFLGAFALLDTEDENVLMDLWEPINEHINATWPGWQAAYYLEYHPSFLSWWTAHHDADDQAGLDLLVGSWLLDKKALTADLEELASALRTFAGAGAAMAHLVAGKGVADAQPAGGSNAILPAWRKAYVHATNGVIWSPHDPVEKAAQIAKMHSYVEGLVSLAPDMGAYVNEANVYQRDWQKAFWGENYPLLLSIKRDIDPDDVLWCHPCVGSERWREIGNRLCQI